MPFCSNTWYRVSHWKLMFSFQTLYISNLLIYYFCSVDSHCGTFFSEVSVLKMVQSTSKHWLQCGLLQPLQNHSNEGPGSIPCSNRRGSEPATGKFCLMGSVAAGNPSDSWGCIGDYAAEDTQGAERPAAEALQLCRTLQLRPNVLFLIRSQPEE